MESMSYFPRHLRIMNEADQAQKVDELVLITMQGPKVILGEPGMGKSELIRELGRRLNVQPISATRFMLHRRPDSFVIDGKPLLIDGLDEAMARRDGDAVDLVLSKLEEAGSPDFILSCRAREWQSRNESNMRQIYNVDPKVLILEALSRPEAEAFLRQRHPTVDAEQVLSHLETNSIAELYSNPLTLGLIGRVAQSDTELPPTRADLFDRVCRLIWPEHDSDRQDLGLGSITEDEALSAAGAIAAGMLLSGADAVSLAGPLHLGEGEIRLADLSSLPGGSATKEVFSSKLFQTTGVGLAAPIHRVIAEYLGARWLAQEAKTSRAQRRLLQQLNGAGSVPSSLRGLHAWIAFHSSSMANAVITADPFGVLRYGDTNKITAEQAECMFDALNALADADPYFRAQDWESHAAVGLMIPKLRDRIQALITSTDSNTHLRSLLIEGLKGTHMAGDLADSLESIVFSTNHFYGERADAYAALIPHRDRFWSQVAVGRLISQCTNDSARLAEQVIDAIEGDVSDEVFTATLLAGMGLSYCPLPRLPTSRTISLYRYRNLGNSLHLSRLPNVLDLLTAFTAMMDGLDHNGSRDLAQFIALLIHRMIEQCPLSCSGPTLWKWLGAMRYQYGTLNEDAKALIKILGTNDSLRHSIQFHALYEVRPRCPFWTVSFELDNRMVSLTLEDTLWFLEQLEGCDLNDPSLRQDWQDLMAIGIRRHGMSEELRETALKFRCDGQELELFIDQLVNPEKPSWQIDNERREAIEKEQERRNHEKDRQYFTKMQASLRAGDLSQIITPAKVYLGVEYVSVGSSEGLDALREWLGDELAKDSLTGFEAVLHRPDLPSPLDVAHGFAEHQIYNFCYPIMAGLLARQRSKLSIEDVAPDTQKIGLLLCLDESLLSSGDEVSALSETISLSVIHDAQCRIDFVTLWLEPSLRAGKEHISGLYEFLNEDQWNTSSVVLSQRWLMSMENLPDSIESDLIDCLIRAGEITSLAQIAEHRAMTPFRDQDQLLIWLSVDVLARFSVVMPDLSDISINNPEFIWLLRDRFEIKRHGSISPVSVAQAKWVIAQFRTSWPYAVLQGTGHGTHNSYDATDFLKALINRIANDTSAEASEALRDLIAAPVDSYSELIRHLAAEQKQARSEKEFIPISPKSLGQILTEGAPSNAEDLKSLVMEELAVAQKILSGDELDQARDFWQHDGVPYDENRCRDRLAALIGPALLRYGVLGLTEADMPNTKRADLAFACGQIQLPMEVKGQWHPDVWDAATAQLDQRYLIDWRSDDRGIYCVLWFGDLPTTSKRRLKKPPEGFDTPKSADDMRTLLINRIPEQRRTQIDVVVLDLTTGKPKPKPKPKPDKKPKPKPKPNAKPKLEKKPKNTSAPSL